MVIWLRKQLTSKTNGIKAATRKAQGNDRGQVGKPKARWRVRFVAREKLVTALKEQLADLGQVYFHKSRRLY